MKPRRVKISSQDREQATYDRADSFDYDTPAMPRHSAFSYWLGRAAIFLGAAIVASYVIVAIALDLFVDTDRVHGWVTPRVSAALNRSVTIEDAHITLLPRPSLVLADISVDNLAGFDGPTLARLDEARLDVSWLPLFLGRVRIHHVRLEGAMIHLAIDENGVSNFGDLVPRRTDAPQAGESAPFAAAIQRISVANGSLTFFDAPRNRSLGVIGAGLDATLSDDGEGGWRADVAMESDSLHARMESVSEEIMRVAGPSGHFTAHGDAGLTGIDLERGYLELAGDTLAMRGRIAGLATGQPSFDVLLTNSDMSARALARAFPADLRSSLLPLTEGTLSVTLQVQGGMNAADQPLMRGAVRLDDVTLRLRGEVVAEHVTGLVEVDAASISFDSVDGTLAGGPFELSGSVARDARSTAALAAKVQPDLDALDRLGLIPGGATLSGNAAFDFSLVGPLRALDSLDIVGTATLDGFQLKHERLGAPVYIPEGVMTVSGRQMSWSDLTVLVGTDRVTSTGMIGDLTDLWSEDVPRIDARLAGQRLDLDAIFPPNPAESQPTYAQIAFAHLGGRSIDGRSATDLASERELSRPQRASALGSLAFQLDTLISGPHRLEGVVARLELTDSAISIPEATFSAWGGTARGSLRLGIGPAAQQSFALALTVDDAEAASFLAVMTPVGDAVTGTLDFEVDVTGFTDRALLPGADSLSGGGRIVLEDGRLAGTGMNAALADFLEAAHWAEIPFTRWDADFDIRGREIEVHNAELTGELGRVVLSGALDFSGAADLSMALAVPAGQLQAVSLRRTGIGPSVVEQLRTAGRPLDLGLRLSGTLAAPTLEPDAANAVALARQ